MKVYVEGKLKTRTWEKDGQIRRKTEIVAENIQILYRPERPEAKDEGLEDERLEDERLEAKGEFFNGLFR
jgi:single-strand DNA-binding protein